MYAHDYYICNCTDTLVSGAACMKHTRGFRRLFHVKLGLMQADWSPNGQSGFGYQANWEPEMPEAFKVLSGRWPRLHSHKAPQTSWMRKGSVRFFGTSDPQTYQHRFRDTWGTAIALHGFIAFRISLRRLSIAEPVGTSKIISQIAARQSCLSWHGQIKWRWVVHGFSSRLLFVCLWGTWANFHRSCILSVYIDLRCLRNVPGPAWGELQTEAEIYGKPASWTRARGHSSLRRIQRSGTFGSWTYSNMSNEMGGLCKSREIGRVSTSRKFWTPKWWISGGPKALDATVGLAGRGVAARKPCPATHVPGPQISSIDCGWLLGRLDANSGDMLDSVRYCSGTAALHGSTIQNRRDPWTWRLEFMSPKALHFVLEEMLAWAPAPVLARHRYGCRVLDRLRVTTRFFKTLKLKPSQNFFCTMKPQLSVFFAWATLWSAAQMVATTSRKKPTHPQPNLATETSTFTNMK